MTWVDLERKQLEVDEGLRLKPYLDSEGVMTIGYGRNLESRGISHDEADVLLANDVKDHLGDCDKIVPGFRYLDDDRKGVCLNMCFNLGSARLKTFRKFLAALERRDYQTAAAEMKDSLWYVQVGARAERLVSRMLGSEYV